MSYCRNSAASAVRNNCLSTLHKHLKATVFTTLLLSATALATGGISQAIAQQATGKYFNADGTRTDDLEKAAETWRADKEFQGNWGVGAIKAEYAYARGFTGKNIKIGIFDTGVDRTHPEFAGDGKLSTIRTQGIYAYTWVDSYDKNEIYIHAGVPFDLDGGVPYKGDDHGTHVGGIAAATRGSGKMHGVAFGARIVAANNGDAGPEHGDINSNDGASYRAGFDALVASGVRIINNSWGIGWRKNERPRNNREGLVNVDGSWNIAPYKHALISQYLENPHQGAIEGMTDAAKAGVLMVFAGGEDNNKGGDATNALPYLRPEVEDHWINVEMLDEQNILASDGCGLTRYYCISAPGVDIFSTIPENKYEFNTGTSMAAPNVSGALAVLMERYPYMTNGEVRDTLFTTARHLDEKNGTPDTKRNSPNRIFGWGLVDLQKAMSGPGQLYGHMAPTLPVGMADTWSNDISDEAIRNRSGDDRIDQKQLQAMLDAGVWESGKKLKMDEQAFLQSLIKAHESAIATRGLDPLSGKTYVGSLEKLGDGHLILEGKNSYTGSTWVRGGTLSVNGSLTSEVTVDGSGIGVVNPETGIVTTTGGTLGGTGSIGALSVHSGGTVAPGNSVGTLHAASATFDKGSKLAIEVNDQGKMDQLAVNGDVRLFGGVVTVSPESGGAAFAPDTTLALLKQAPSHTYNQSILTGTISGTFDRIEPAYTFIGGTLNYEPANVILTLARNKAAFADFANSRNGKAIAANIDSLGFGHALYDKVVVNTVPDSLADDFNSMSGEIHASVQGVLAEDSRFVRDAASDRIRAAFGDGTGGKAAAPVLAYGPDGADKTGILASADTRRTAIWAEGYGSWSNRDSDGNAAGLSRNVGGFVTGLDGVIADSWRFGLLAGYGNTSLKGGGSSASADSYQMGVYGGTRINALTLSLGASLAHHDIDTDRTASLGSIMDSDNASYAAKSVQVFGEASYRFDTAYAALEPFAGAAYTNLKTDGFSETGGITALSSHGDTTELTTTTLGIRASHGFALGETTTLTAHGMAGWRHAFGDTTPTASLAFASSSVSIDGLPIATDTGLVEAGFDVNLGKATSLGISYNGQFSSQAHDNAVKADLTVRF